MKTEGIEYCFEKRRGAIANDLGRMFTDDDGADRISSRVVLDRDIGVPAESDSAEQAHA
ncbi:hypothetical protein FHT86_004772 [Rhizobium sp. BK313]|uniref:hypothetical protein n=1 Tax=Rhizobium sp. BK313 TaxID=2587081 RepID=UPI0010E091E5|nr:hypothetical protein [Rhizobium sp. BK313]MBB3456464.1 hypothetical protein [Rhizobium sp. BK313]